jgi:hypothetical protein
MKKDGNKPEKTIPSCPAVLAISPKAWDCYGTNALRYSSLRTLTKWLEIRQGYGRAWLVKGVGRTSFRARYPSRKSVKDATTKMPDAQAAAAGSGKVKSHMTGGMANRRPMVSIVGRVHIETCRFSGLHPLFSGAEGVLV